MARYLKALREGIPAGSSQSGGRPPALTYTEESAVVVYIVTLSRGNFPTYRAMLVNAANTLRSKRIPPMGKVSKAWIGRFLKDHPELKVATCRAIDIKRNAFELDSDSVIAWFDHYNAIWNEFKVRPTDIWNSDECGCRIGYVSSRTKVMVVRMIEKPKVRLNPVKN